MVNEIKYREMYQNYLIGEGWKSGERNIPIEDLLINELILEDYGWRSGSNKRSEARVA